MMIVPLIWLRRTLCVMVILAATGCGTQSAGGDSRSASSDDAPALLEDAWVYYFPDHPDIGIEVRGQFTADRDGTTSAATLNMAGRSTTAYLYPPKWDTDQWPPDPHQSLRAGHAMAVQGNVMPACDGEAHDPPVISVPYRTADGEEATLQFAIAAKGKSIAQTAAYIDDLTRQFCSQDVTVHTGAISGNKETGEGRVDYWWTNPGPGTVTVMSKAWQGPNGARWLATSPIEVPADGQDHKLQVFGVDGVCDDPYQTPLSLGLLVVTHPDGTSDVIQKDEPRFGGISDVCHGG
jgi:hypothetical protein